MQVCYHYILNPRTRKYESLVEPKAKALRHVFYCKQCNMKLHDADVRRLNLKIRDLNTDWAKKFGIDDKIHMDDPVRGQYKDGFE